MGSRFLDKKHKDVRNIFISEDIDAEAFVLQLAEEVDEITSFFRGKPSCSIRRRASIRANISFVEGVIHYLKFTCYKRYYCRVKPTLDLWNKEVGITLPKIGFYGYVDEDELFLVTDRKVEIDDRGHTYFKEHWRSTLTDLKFTFRIWCKMFGIEVPKFEGESWDSLKRSVDSRNRVTHPNALRDFVVSDDEMRDLKNGVDWFQDTSLALIKQSEETATFSSVQRLADDYAPEQRADFLQRYERFRRELVKARLGT